MLDCEMHVLFLQFMTFSDDGQNAIAWFLQIC